MMTFKQVSTGSAYRYYLRQVAVGDGRRPRGKNLDQAQEEAGVPPGVWMGKALPAVGLTAGSRVTHRQMANLFGKGRHPASEQIIETRLAAGDTSAKAERATRLGYRIQKWSGADLVFRAPGSVQIFWALGTDAVREVIEAAHTRVIDEVVDQIETGLLIVRRGRDSNPERAEPGVIAARFRHYESRDGQPLLHDHLVLSVKVRRTDGQWGTLHTRTLLEYTVALSELYNQRVLEEICTDLNLATTPRYPTPGQRPVMELAGIPEDLIDWAATRNKATMQRLGELVAQYRSRTSQPVTAKIRHRMMARASTDTRPAKKTAHPLPVLRARWRDGATARVGQGVVDRLLDLARTAARTLLALARPVMDLTAAALDVVATISVFHPKQFRHRHLLAEARRYLARTFHGQPVQPHTDTAIVATALRLYCRDITPTARGDQQLLPLAHHSFTTAWEPRQTGAGTAMSAYQQARAEAVTRAAQYRAQISKERPVAIPQPRLQGRPVHGQRHSSAWYRNRRRRG